MCVVVCCFVYYVVLLVVSVVMYIVEAWRCYGGQCVNPACFLSV